MVRMSVGRPGSPFSNEERAMGFLVNRLANKRYGFRKNKPREIVKGGYAVFAFNRQVKGESRVMEVVTDETRKVENVVFGPFKAYKNPVTVAVVKGQDGFPLPKIPGQQFGYYDKRVLRELRTLGENGVLSGKKVLNAKQAREIGKRNERCAMEYERRIRKAHIKYCGEEDLGYDFESTKGERRHIEVKTEGMHVELTPNELYVAQRLRRNYFLYIVSGDTIRIIRDPASDRFNPKKYTEHRWEPINWKNRGEAVHFICGQT